MLKEARYYSIFNGRKYNDVCPAVNVLYEEDFFIPCRSYHLLIPVKKKADTDLNVFEMTVLRLLNLRPINNNELAETICCEKDFINFLIISLTEREYLDENRHLTRLAKEKIQVVADDAIDVEYRNARVFAFKGEADLLPIICFDENDIQIGYTPRRGKIEITTGSNAGNKRTSTYDYYKFDAVDVNRIPGKREIRNLLADYLRLSKNINRAYKIGNINTQISVSRADDVFIHFKAILQNGHIDAETCMVSDGFLASNSNSMVINYLKGKKIPDGSGFFKGVLTRARQMTLKKARGNIFGLDAYPQIKKYLDKISLSEGNHIDDIDKAQQNNVIAIRNMYAALEWVFHYHLRKNILSNELWRCFEQANQHDNYMLTVNFAKKIGLRLRDFPTRIWSTIANKKEAEGKAIKKVDIRTWLISKADGHKIKVYHSSLEPVPTLDVILPLCIAEAAFNGASRFHQLIREMPELIDGPASMPAIQYRRLEPETDNTDVNDSETVEAEYVANPVNDFKNVSDFNEQTYYNSEESIQEVLRNTPFALTPLREAAKASRHGNINIDKRIVAYWLDNVKKIVSILLPDYGGIGETEFNAINGTSMDKVNALVTLWQIIDSNIYNTLSSNLQQDLMGIAPSLDDSRMMQPVEFILTLSKLLEATFKEAIAKAMPAWNCRRNKQEAIEYIKVRIEGSEIPKGLMLVNESFYNNAVTGQKSTVGALCLAWAGHNTSDAYSGQILLDILKLTDQIAGLRLHGNNINLHVDDEMLKTYRAYVCQVIAGLYK